MGRGGKPGHVHPDLGDDGRSSHRADTWHLIESSDRRGERRQQRLDLLIHRGDVVPDAVDAGQHPLQQEAVVGTKCPSNASSSRPILARIRLRAIWANTLGSRSPAINAPSIWRPDTPKMSVATVDSLMQASSSNFSTRFFSAVRTATSSLR